MSDARPGRAGARSVSFRAAFIGLLMMGCAPTKSTPARVDVPPERTSAGAASALGTGRISGAVDEGTMAAVPRGADLLALARRAAPDPKSTLIVGRGARALAAAWRGPSVTVAEDGGGRKGGSTYELVIATDAADADAVFALREQTAKGGVLVARWSDRYRGVRRENPVRTVRASGASSEPPLDATAVRFASFTSPRMHDKTREFYEHLLVERNGSTPLGIGDVAPQLDVLPSEPFVRDVSVTRDAPARKVTRMFVKLGGFVARLPTGEVVIDLPHSELGATHVHVPELERELSALAGPTPSPVSDGKRLDPRSIAGALDTGAAMVGTRPTSTIVMLEGWLSLRAWEEAASGSAPELGVRSYELSTPRLSSIVKSEDWTRAFARYEAQSKTLFKRHILDLSQAERTFERASAPIEALVEPNELFVFELFRFWRYLYAAIHDVYAIQRARGLLGPSLTTEELVPWLKDTFPESHLDGAFARRPQPTASEREGYRTAIVFGALQAEHASYEADNAGKPSLSCQLLAESHRLWHAANANAGHLRAFDAAHASQAKACGLVF